MISHLLSRTQILLTKITQICQEIRDIKRSKINNILTKLPELSQHHTRILESSGNYGKDGPDGVYYPNTSSNPQMDRFHSPSKCPLCGQPYAPMLPSPIPSSPTLARTSIPTPESPSVTAFAPPSPSTKACMFDDPELEEELSDKEQYLFSSVSTDRGGMGGGE